MLVKQTNFVKCHTCQKKSSALNSEAGWLLKFLYDFIILVAGLFMARSFKCGRMAEDFSERLKSSMASRITTYPFQWPQVRKEDNSFFSEDYVMREL